MGKIGFCLALVLVCQILVQNNQAYGQSNSSGSFSSNSSTSSSSSSSSTSTSSNTSSSSSSSSVTVGNQTTSSSNSSSSSSLSNSSTTTSTSNSSSTSASFSFSISFGSSCSAANIATKLKEAIQREINSKAKSLSDIYKNIASLAQSLKANEDFYEALVNRTMDDAILPVQKTVDLIKSIEGRDLINEALDAKLLIDRATREAFKTDRNYGCYAEKQVKLAADKNVTLNKKVNNISVTNIYNKCSAQMEPTCGNYFDFFKCVSGELNEFLVFINGAYKEAIELNTTATTKDVTYQERVVNWYKEDAKTQIDTIKDALTGWIVDVQEENERAKRRCDEVVLTQVQNHYNDQLPKLTTASNCISRAAVQRKNFNYCRDTRFCGKMESALSGLLHEDDENFQVIDILKNVSKTYYTTALEQLNSFTVGNIIKDVDSVVRLVANETRKFDNVRVKLSNPYSLSEVCNATNVPSKSYCSCVANYGSEQIKLLSNIVLNVNNLCAIQEESLSQGKLDVLQFVTNLADELKGKAQAEAKSIIRLNEFVL